MELELQPLELPHKENQPIIIAGPCSAETEEQVMDTAQQLSANGCKIFRAGVWKPRTKPGCFEGNGEKALPWLKRVKDETGMLIATEVATPEHVEFALKYDVDIFWIGARTTTNPFAIQARCTNNHQSVCHTSFIRPTMRCKEHSCFGEKPCKS